MSLTRTELRNWLVLAGGFRTLMDTLDRQLRSQSGISHDDYMILTILYREPSGSLRMSLLGARLSSSPSRMTHAVARFERHGWVERSKSSSDRRGVEVAITALGREKVHQASIGLLALVKELVFETLGQDDVRALAGSMSLIQQAAEAYNR